MWEFFNFSCIIRSFFDNQNMIKYHSKSKQCVALLGSFDSEADN